METDIDQFVIDKIKEIRQQKGISQAELADCLNVSRGYIGDCESYKRPARYNLEMLNEIAKILDCSVKDFLPDKPL